MMIQPLATGNLQAIWGILVISAMIWIIAVRLLVGLEWLIERWMDL